MSEMNYTVKQIKCKIFEWYKGQFIKHPTFFDVEIAKNEENILIIDFTFAECLAQIHVYEPDFAPFKYVAFDALSLVDESRIFYFYDTDRTTENEVIEQLNKGIEICSSYKPKK